jgi:hypothetical protein
MFKLFVVVFALFAMVPLYDSYAGDPTQKIVDGECYKLVLGQEGENAYWVPCDKDNTDIGFNKPNCEELLRGRWRSFDKSCIQEVYNEEMKKSFKYRWHMEGIYLKVDEDKSVGV